MVNQPQISQASLYSLAKMVSNAGFKRLIYDTNYKQYARKMKSLLVTNGIQIENKCTVREVIQTSYDHLLTHYRHEYLYKSALLNSYILQHYSLSDTILLNEFKIGNSKADAVLVNGTNKVFEIKTELDSPDRLNSQLHDYYKAFSEVYILVHHAAAEKYKKIIPNQVGVMTFTNNHIALDREASIDQTRLDPAVMMKALRKEEYLQVVKKLSGEIPAAPPVTLFKTCLEIVSQYAHDEVQSEFLKVIKQRINHELNQLIASQDLPNILRLSCYYSNISQNEYLSLIKRLNFSL